MDCSWIGWCALQPDAQAAWVQAVGSVAAILVAVAIPVFQHRREQRRDRHASEQRARALALAHLPLFRNWHHSIAGALEAFSRADGPLHWSQWEDLRTMLKITSDDTELMKRSSEFGDASPTVQRFLYHTLLASFAAENAALEEPSSVASDAGLTASHEEAFRRHLRNASLALSKAISDLEKVAAGGALNPYRPKGDG